jgi:hypothetical protein
MTKIKDAICDVIEEAATGLTLLEDDYFIIGASALILSNVEIGTTLDIDILTTVPDSVILEEAWNLRKKEDYKPINSNLFRSNFARYAFTGLDIEIMGGLEINTDGSWEKLLVKDYCMFDARTITVRIPTLQEQKRILGLFGRDKDLSKVELIDEYIFESGL